MTDTETEGQGLSKLVSGPGIAALAILGVAVLAASNLFGSDTILKEVVTEIIAGFGNAILILALFELFFRAGIERLIRNTTGSEAHAQSARQVREALQNLGPGDREAASTAHEAKLDSIEEELRSLVDRDVPELKNGIDEVRKLLLNAERGHED